MSNPLEKRDFLNVFEDEMRIETFLPEWVRSFTYARNHHYIKVTDQEGNELILNPTAMVKYTCKVCSHFFYSGMNIGKARCPFCGGETVPTWGTMQLCFVPEDESKFHNCQSDLSKEKK